MFVLVTSLCYRFLSTSEESSGGGAVLGQKVHLTTFIVFAKAGAWETEIQSASLSTAVSKGRRRQCGGTHRLAEWREFLGNPLLRYPVGE